MIKEISWKTIESVWCKHLWPYRTDRIESRSAMHWPNGYNMANMTMDVFFFGYFDNKTLVGVNSGHNCFDNQFRSRGLWVHPSYRKQGIGQKLLLATIQKGRELDNKIIWSYPRDTSWSTYQAVGFKLDTDWAETENGRNAYCSIQY